MSSFNDRPLDVICLGRAAVDLYGEQIGSRLEDMGKTLGTVTDNTEEIAILAAARLGRTRLIDNVRLALNPVSDWGMLAGGR